MIKKGCQIAISKVAEEVDIKICHEIFFGCFGYYMSNQIICSSGVKFVAKTTATKSCSNIFCLFELILLLKQED